VSASRRGPAARRSHGRGPVAGQADGAAAFVALAAALVLGAASMPGRAVPQAATPRVTAPQPAAAPGAAPGGAGSAPAPVATEAPPVATAEAPNLRQLARELRVLLRDTPVELEAKGGELLRLRIPAGWLFRVDDATLRPEALVRLDALGLALATPRFAGTHVEVVGHSDSLGRREPNEAFTLRRATAVAALLAARGVDPARLATRGAGESELREKKEDTPAARQRNRRVELEIRPARPSSREAS
jgi:outer membrane protein OmpA-like peptidoglycan-associated protein